MAQGLSDALSCPAAFHDAQEAPQCPLLPLPASNGAGGS